MSSGACTRHYASKSTISAVSGGPGTSWRLTEDHALLSRLLADFEAVPADAEPDELLRHLDGLEAIMESQ